MQNYSDMYLIQRKCSTNESISDCAHTHRLQGCVVAVGRCKPVSSKMLRRCYDAGRVNLQMVTVIIRHSRRVFLLNFFGVGPLGWSEEMTMLWLDDDCRTCIFWRHWKWIYPQTSLKYVSLYSKLLELKASLKLCNATYYLTNKHSYIISYILLFVVVFLSYYVSSSP